MKTLVEYVGGKATEVTLGVIFLAVCLLYAGAVLCGWHLSRTGRLTVWLTERRRALTDPITASFARWHDRVKIEYVRQKQWVRLWLVVCANNLLAVAFVSRTLYGVSLVLPAYFTLRQGVTHGVFLKLRGAPSSCVVLSVAVLELASYLLATALGMNVGVALLAGGAGALTGALRDLALLYPLVVVTLLVGAGIEVSFVQSRMPASFQFPPGLDIEQMRARALEALRRQGQ